MKEYCILIVLYKINLEDCPTIKSLIVSKQYLQKSKVVIWDNSPIPQTNSQIDWFKDQFHELSYIHTSSNTSLSKIYNKVFKEHKDYEHLIIFDQDSNFSKDYFEKIDAAKKEHRFINLFVPVIRYGNAIMSPGYYYHFKGRYRQEIMPGVNSAKNMCVITSGMCVSLDYLNNRFEDFNEKLTFYGIDTFFSLQYRQDNEYFYVLNCFFDHSLSLNENEQYETKLRRFTNHKKSLLVLTENSNLITKLMCKFYVVFQTVKFKMKHNKAVYEKNS